MKKTTKTIAIMAAMAVFTTAGLFAQPKPADNGARPVIERPEGLEFKDAKTIAVSVKVVNKKDITNIYLKLKDGKTYIADAFGPEGNEAIKALLKRNCKKAVVTGILNKDTGVFNVIKLGGFGSNDGADEK